MFPKTEITDLSFTLNCWLGEKFVDWVDPIKSLQFSKKLVVKDWTFTNLVFDCQKLSSNLAVQLYFAVTVEIFLETF